MSIKLFREQRAEHAYAIKRLADAANKDHRDFSAAEQLEWDERNKNYDRLTVQIRNAEVQDEMNSPIHHDGILPGRGDVGRPSNIRSMTGNSDSGGDTFVDNVSGRSIRAIRHGESFRQAYCPNDSGEPIHIGKLVRGLACGKWTDADAEKREVQIGISGTAGGYLLSDEASGYVIDLARNASSVMALGPQVIPMSSQQMNVARIGSDPSAFWRSEGQVLTSSNATLEQVVLNAKTVGVLVPISLELLEDSPNAADVVQTSMAQALGLGVDLGALRGEGTGEEVMGVRYTPGITTTPVNGSLTYDVLLDSLTPLEIANEKATGWICSPRTSGFIRKLKDGSSNYLSDHPAIAALQKQVSSQIPTTLTGGSGGSTDTELYVADWTKLLFGIRRRATLEVFRSGTGVVGSTSMDAINRLMVWVRLYMRLDINLSRPAAFNVLTGITV